DSWKNRGLTPDEVKRGEAAAFAEGRGLKLYAAYQERLKTLNAVDFGDLLLENIRLFREHGDVLRQYQHRFRFILVDEYQDTNVPQYLWLRLLGQSTAPASPSPDSSSKTGVNALTVGEGRGGGSGDFVPDAPQPSTPTPDPSPQGGGEHKSRAGEP